MGLKKTTGGKAPQEAQLVVCCGALTPQEAAKVIFRDDGQAYLSKAVYDTFSKETVKDRFAAWADQELKKNRAPGDILQFLRVKADGDNRSAIERLIWAAKRSDVIPPQLLPADGTPFGKWLREQASFASQFEAAWIALAVAEGREWPRYYQWRLERHCQNKARASLAEWLAMLAPQQASQAA